MDQVGLSDIIVYVHISADKAKHRLCTLRKQKKEKEKGYAGKLIKVSFVPTLAQRNNRYAAFVTPKNCAKILSFTVMCEIPLGLGKCHYSYRLTE